MKKIVVKEDVKGISDEIALKCVSEAAYFPIDRNFIEKYIFKILCLNPIEFIFYNVEKNNPTYCNILFICLPELWENIDVDDLDYLLNNFSNSLSFIIMIHFSYKYLEIDMLEMIITKAKFKGVFNEVRTYLKNQYPEIIKTEEDFMELEFGIGKEFLCYDETRWAYIRQKLVTDKRVIEAIQDIVYLKKRLDELLR